MVEVHPADKTVAEQLAARHGIHTPVRAMTMSREGQDLGYVVYVVERDTMELLVLCSKEEPLEELLVRACLNDAVNALATDAICRNPLHFPLLQRLGFVQGEGMYTIFIPDFFMRPCSGCHRT